MEGRPNPNVGEFRNKRPGPVLLNSKTRNGKLSVPNPNSLPKGPFRKLSIHFPEGAVISLRFRKEQSHNISQSQCEEIYRLVDIGIGLEFVALATDVIKGIERELKSVSQRHTPSKT
jgi:hypothetical protein